MEDGAGEAGPMSGVVFLELDRVSIESHGRRKKEDRLWVLVWVCVWVSRTGVVAGRTVTEDTCDC